MDHHRLLIYLVGWRIFLNMLAMSAAAFFYINFIMGEDEERETLNERSLSGYESHREDLESEQSPESARSVSNAPCAPSTGATSAGPSRKRSRADMTSEFIGIFKDTMSVAVHDLADLKEVLPQAPRGSLVQEVKSLGLTRNQRMDVILQLSTNPAYERLFWELEGEERMEFVMRIMCW